MTRQQKTPRQRAQEQLDLATRVADRLTRQAKKARTELDRLNRERDAAVVRRDYLAQHPDLKSTTSKTSSTTTPRGDTA